jgi:hypothetical protein
MFLLLISIAFFTGCKKDSDNTPATQSPHHYLKIGFRFEVDNSPLGFNSISYYNDALNHYSVTSLRYYLSRISLVTDSNSRIELLNYLFIDASSPPVLQFDLAGIPKGKY